MAKPSLLLLHGALGAASQFAPWLPLLEADFEVRTLDFEGHGSQPFADRPFAIAHFAENLEAYIRANNLEKVNVFGYSMGGYVAMYLAQRKPELFGKISTFASKLAWTPEGAAREVRMLDVNTILEKVPKFAQALEARHFGNEWKEHLARTAAMMLALGDAPALKDEDFPEIKVPLRLGVGDSDTMVTLEETISAFRKIPGAQLFVMPATQHPVEKIDAVRIVEAIRAYFL
jgi:pimeloyl-ACP methyl ester carboxylesterase